MKKINLIIALLLSAITYSQMINYTSVRLEDGQDDAYIEYEKFWSKIHEKENVEQITKEEGGYKIVTSNQVISSKKVGIIV